jgi:hypothetical protein
VQSTNLGKLVRGLCKNSDARIAKAARGLTDKWVKLVSRVVHEAKTRCAGSLSLYVCGCEQQR